MPNELIKFWQRSKLTKPPFFHPDDESTLWQGNGRFLDSEITDFDTLISQKQFGPFNDKLKLSLSPVPYAGDVAHAKFVILPLNPGLDYVDYWAETRRPEFRKRMEDNLRQSFRGVEFPFFGLDPELCWHGGFAYWEGKLRGVIRKIAEKSFDENYFKALRDLSKKLACLELVPYHSPSFHAHALIKDLPSCRIVKEFVHESLVPDAKAGKRILIVTRQVKEWKIQRDPKFAKNIIVYSSAHARGASLGPKSGGGKAILRDYGIE